MKGQKLPLNGATQFKEFLSDFPNTHNIRVFLLKSPYIHPVFGPPFTFYTPPPLPPSLSEVRKVRKFY
jgi:hypothetical protein